MSPAERISFDEADKDTLNKPLMSMIKRRGSITEPRGTPEVTGRGDELMHEMITCRERAERQECSQLIRKERKCMEESRSINGL